ncbi:hypothetical protein KVT40_007967 [Elsinoe batatas]|uniref:Uncharacterized protein n=1 Tax=Elsinoe batatas TaxID=2601811 RepID=A0A8K0KSC1_9PEZI|nr:hypothetical protein KVT40_007967 [Elsinoe batatas]
MLVQIGVPKRDAFLQHFIEDLSDRRVEPLGAVQDDVDPIEFVNFEAFLARLLAVDISTDFMGFAEEPMIWAFKDDHSGQDQRLRDAYVLAAAQWILTSASALLALCQEGKRYLTVAKWMEWQEGFRKVADDEQHSQECRKIAGQVADMMALEEKVVKG